MMLNRGVTVPPAGLAVWAAALEGGPQSREPDPVGEPVHDPPVPQPVPDRTRRHLWAGEQQHGGTAALHRQTNTAQQRQHTGETTTTRQTQHLFTPTNMSSFSSLPSSYYKKVIWTLKQNTSSKGEQISNCYPPVNSVYDRKLRFSSGLELTCLHFCKTPWKSKLRNVEIFF